MGFKIIAIKALNECDDSHVKILQKNYLYFFYGGYDFSDLEIGVIKKHDNNFNNLYDITSVNGRKIEINMSAIVGKNGVGKSTLIELLTKSINNLSYHFRIDNINRDKRIKKDIQFIKGLFVRFFYEIDNIIYSIELLGNKYEVYRFIKANKGNYLREKINYYKFDLEDMFYSILVDYSHYGLNSLNEGEWLNKIFHKNDGYQTPIVLNPMRKNGNVDVNSENYLVRQRLIANLLRQPKAGFNFRRLLDDLWADSISLNPKEIKKEFETPSGGIINLEEVYGDDELNHILFKLLDVFVGANVYDYKVLRKREFYYLCRNYIVYKLMTISYTYPEYRRFFVDRKYEFKQTHFYFYLNKLKNDDSHIVFKLKQVVNFLIYNHIKCGDNISIDDLSIPILNLSNEDDRFSIIEFLPPPIFDIDINLRINDIKDVKFDSLSSGQKQLIYSVNTILYHLINIDSVSNNKIRFNRINVVLEEIELYFHPDLQRRFVLNLINSIRNINLNSIDSINFSFVTHSPFVLSDFISSNVMYLKNDNISKRAIQNSEEKLTFGANIHDILNDSFFFEGGVLMGGVAQKHIDDVINDINNNDNIDENEVLRKIEIINEPIVKYKLMEMFSERLGKKSALFNKSIDKEIERLRALKK